MCVLRRLASAARGHPTGGGSRASLHQMERQVGALQLAPPLRPEVPEAGALFLRRGGGSCGEGLGVQRARRRERALIARVRSSPVFVLFFCVRRREQPLFDKMGAARTSQPACSSGISATASAMVALFLRTLSGRGAAATPLGPRLHALLWMLNNFSRA